MSAGLFSVPLGERPLNLRRERDRLARLFAEIDSDGRAVDLRVLQYVVMRDRLREVLAEGEGLGRCPCPGTWRAGRTAAGNDTGEPVRVRGGGLVKLLAVAGSGCLCTGQLRWPVLSSDACSAWHRWLMIPIGPMRMWGRASRSERWRLTW